MTAVPINDAVLQDIPLERVLTGGFSEMKHYALKDSPHVKFLEQFKDCKKIDAQLFRRSEYYHHGCRDMEVFGSFFGIVDQDDIIQQAKYFLELYRFHKSGGRSEMGLHGQDGVKEHHSDDDPPKAAQISGTDYYVIKDGHHRFAVHYVLGKKYTKALMIGTAKISWEELVERGIIKTPYFKILKIKQSIGRKLAPVILNLARIFFKLKFKLNRSYASGTKRVAFLSEEFFHKDLLPVGGYGITLRFVTDHLNTKDGPIKADVLMCGDWSRDFSEVTVKRYHNADLVFLPQKMKFKDHLAFMRLLDKRRICAVIGIDYYRLYEYYLLNTMHLPWIVWIKDPKDRVEWEKFMSLPLEQKNLWVESKDEYIAYLDKERQSFNEMARKSLEAGRKIHFASESDSLTRIAERELGVTIRNATHLPKPIPIPAIERIIFSPKPTFLFIARLDPVKRPVIYFELAKHFPQADFLVAGMPHEPEIMDPVIAPYRNVPNLKFLGRVDGKEKEDAFKSAWAVVNTSIHEGIPVSYLEAFIYGKPVIGALDPDRLASRFGIYVGEIEGEGNDKASVQKFVDAIARVIDGRFNKEEIGAKAQQYVKEYHSYAYYESQLLKAVDR